MHTKNKGSHLFRNLLLLAFLFILVIILSACGAAATEAPAAPEEPAVPEAPPAATEAPAQPVEPGAEYPVQYGQDTRLEPFQHTDSKLKEMAASVAIFVHNSQVQVSGNAVKLDGYTLNEMSEMGWLVSGASLPMCADELFSTQPAPGFCTGFLVRDNILVTAGHCLQKAACSDTSIVFGYQMESSDSLAEVREENVFRCAEVIRQVLPSQENGYLDYAILRLDRPTGRAGLNYSADDLLQGQENVAVVGYPSGLPQKIASNALVLSNDAGSPFFIANLDTFGSNSGSPVINTDTYQVEGILVRGTNDYVVSGDGSCVQVNRCPEGGDSNCAGENATKMSRLAEDIPDGASASPVGLDCYPGMILVSLLMILARLKRS